MKVVLISCVSKKLNHKARAEELYISSLFKLNMKYAFSLNPDKIFILSAKYGLLSLEEEIEPYDETLNEKKDSEIKRWAEKVLKQLSEEADLENDEIIFLAGEKYRKYLLPQIKNYSIPLKGLGIGRQLEFLKNKTENKCKEIHEIFNGMKRYSFPFNEGDIPKNGIYILFEKGETGHGKDRIVRVGTHTGKNQLPSRLLQHFVNKNKDRSIFRKNIGRAILKKEKDPFLKYWEIDLTTKSSRDKFLSSIDLEKLQAIEEKVTAYMQENLSFVVFQIESKEKRLEVESKIISTISLCKECNSSENWLGLFSPKKRIRKSGLWQVNELYKSGLTNKDIEELNNLLKEDGKHKNN